MTKLLWMTIDRHPDSLKALIRERLEATGWDIFEVSYHSIESMESVPLEEIDAVLLAPARYFPVEYMDRLDHCKLMQIWSSGYDKFNTEDAHPRGITVANNHGSNAISVAEHTILMMLGVSRRAPEMHTRVLTGNWAGNDHGMSSFSLHGKTLGIVGLGNIGTLVAERAQAFGMNIVFSDPGRSASPDPTWSKCSFEELLSTSDYISFHVHLRDETHSMLNSTNMGLLERRPFIINVSRAELIEREGLLAALDAGQIRGAAIDAHYDEPTSASDEIFTHHNLLLSPHVAGSTVDSYGETIQACIANIQRALAGATVLGALTN